MQHLNKEKSIYWIKIIGIFRVYFGFSKAETNWSEKILNLLRGAHTPILKIENKRAV